MKLELSQSLQQQQILAPQMILSMDILLLSSVDLESRVRQEFAENPALEVVDRLPTTEAPPPPGDRADSTFSNLETLRQQQSALYDSPKRRTSSADSKHEALQNTEGRAPGLRETLVEQIKLRSLETNVRDTADAIVNNLDSRGYLLCPEEELKQSLQGVQDEIFDAAMNAVRSLDPPGVGAEDLQHCLLLQLERDIQEYPLERQIIEEHLLDLGMNKIPKIAKDLGKTVEEIKDAVEIISLLDPIPGERLEEEPTIYVRPDVVVEVVDGELHVRVEDGTLPELQVSESCRSILKTSKGNREVTDFVRKKVESAQWLIQAIEQRQRTLLDIAKAVVHYQEDFMIKGSQHLKALKMQTIADIVGVHISTISRAIKGKHIQTPQGLFDMRYFFTGGVTSEDGELESRRNVYLRIGEIIENEDKSKPHSDNQIAKLLQEQGLKIARRTVTKYREKEGIPSSRLRKTY